MSANDNSEDEISFEVDKSPIQRNVVLSIDYSTREVVETKTINTRSGDLGFPTPKATRNKPTKGELYEVFAGIMNPGAEDSKEVLLYVKE